ncbi:RecB family exonuclease [Pseudonocardia broussonetiae]|uniref:PD-(D/E)XK nuclease family protein n=1 Tax=Pseudonocardia broussonetiae TaxID=2736640 RepID=A0A6M6JCW9_9PSEU|nr:PD-(D/E)XK nuclease family protein [Pseudonocardia broussonetiae]QJY44923.1 PD-(D/E)XK nuclease family protein [Pseudonocardia broussonetiae]
MTGQLGFDFVAPRLVKVTPSRLGTWRDCPRRYRLGYLDRTSRGGARATATLGAVVHLALRAYYALPPGRRTPDAAAALVDRNWNGEGFRDAAQQREHRERARGWVAAYVAERAGDEPLGVEQWVSVSTDRIVAEGRVDRIDARGREAVVVDYKTGRRPLTDDDARTSEALALYAVATARTLRRPCTRVELHHLPTGGVHAHEHDEASLAAAVRRAEETAAELAAATDALADGGDPEVLFPPVVSPSCGTCEVRRHCPEGRAAVPEPAPWDGLAP